MFLNGMKGTGFEREGSFAEHCSISILHGSMVKVFMKSFGYIWL
jgi:hypothetical protein